MEFLWSRAVVISILHILVSTSKKPPKAIGIRTPGCSHRYPVWADGPMYGLWKTCQHKIKSRIDIVSNRLSKTKLKFKHCCYGCFVVVVVCLTTNVHWESFSECWCNINIYIEKMPNIDKRSYIVCMADFIQTRKIKFKGALSYGDCYG